MTGNQGGWLNVCTRKPRAGTVSKLQLIYCAFVSGTILC